MTEPAISGNTCVSPALTSGDTRRIGKLIALILRHRPADFGITLDAGGWTDVEALLTALARAGRPITAQQILEIVERNDKQRFALSDDARRIRAQQGHTLAVELGHPVALPPERLYHGTTPRALDGIRRRGLLRGARHHVHLSATPETAAIVGARRGMPIVLAIDAQRMVDAGQVFLHTPNDVWLTERVPPAFIVPVPCEAPPRNPAA
jgi:putative RNA 2'-phosphotransferase